MYHPPLKQNKAPQATLSGNKAWPAPVLSANELEHSVLDRRLPFENGEMQLSPVGDEDRELGGEARHPGSASSRGGLSYNFASIPIFPPPVRGLQRKLTVNAPGDACEQEADSAAEQVMRMPEPDAAVTPASNSGPGVQRACACGGSCADCKNKQPKHEHARTQMKAAGAASTGGIEAPPIVHEVLRSPGQPLDPTTQTFMEPRYGFDFSHVRVHTDEKAAESAQAVQARAYTVGNDVVFGTGEHRPQTQSGQRLLGHELAHVVQQQGSPNPALRMKPVTWAGEFDTDLYGLFKSTRQGDLDTYGVGIRLKFTPGAHVDAEKIAMVQSAQSLVDGKPRVTYRDPKGITSTRMTSIDRGNPQTGIHIDAWPDERTPVVGMTTAKNQSELSESSLPTAPSAEDDICAPGTTSFGSASKGKKPVEAKMCDTPSLSLRDGEAASQHFETTALAVEGVQKGTYYGSVSWGWEKNAGSVKAKILDLQSVSKDVPSEEFAQAADLWNKSQTGTGKKTIPLPIGELKYTSKNAIDLVDEPSHKKPKTLGHLVLNTQVEVIEGIVSTNPDWARVVVIDGKLAGTAGWIRKEALADRKTNIEKAEPKRKK